MVDTDASVEREDVNVAGVMPGPENFRLGLPKILYAAVGLGTVTFALYASMMAREVTGEDGGEFITAAWTLGVPHPPGYPLYCLLAGAFSRLPGLTPAAGVALFSALCAAMTVALLAVLGARPRHALQCVMAERVPPYLRGDALRLQQVLLNLLGNALKFTEAGRVQLRIDYERTGTGWLSLDVEDTGIGIASQHLDRIFDPFAQADASTTRRFGGTGLGTTIARQLIELMRGRIWVESEPGIGSQFHVEIPLPTGEAVSAHQEQEAVNLPPLSVLAADDVPQNLELLQILLSRLGHRISTASNGEEAVRAFAGGQFDIVLMDVQMPVLSGLDASREIRRLEAQSGRPPTPIIALTASVLAEDARAAREAGMDGFASKPVDLHLLTLEIARLLNIPVAPDVATTPRPLPGVRGSVIDWSQAAEPLPMVNEPDRWSQLREMLVTWAKRNWK